MVGHQPEEFNVTHGKQTSSVLRWTLGFFILIIWGALTAYIGYLSAQTVFTKAVIDDLGEVDEVLTEINGELNNTYNTSSFTFEYPSEQNILYSGFGGPATVTLNLIEPNGSGVMEEWRWVELSVEPVFHVSSVDPGGLIKSFQDLIDYWNEQLTLSEEDDEHLGVISVEQKSVNGVGYLEIVELVRVPSDKAMRTTIFVDYGGEPFVARIISSSREEAKSALSTILETIRLK